MATKKKTTAATTTKRNRDMTVSEFGRLGGLARAKALTAAERRAIARAGAAASVLVRKQNARAKILAKWRAEDAAAAAAAAAAKKKRK